jgi:hypothetical protein
MIQIPLKQTWFEIEIDTEFNTTLLDTAVSIEMVFLSPSKKETKVTAARVGTTSNIVYALAIEKIVLNALGIWIAWPYITGPDGRVAESETAVVIKVIREGSI